MPKSTITFDTVREIALTLPGVKESKAYGFPALKVNVKLLACVPANRSAEPASLVVRLDFDDRAELLAADPDVYYVTDLKSANNHSGARQPVFAGCTRDVDLRELAWLSRSNY